jgi:hypothetical protein
MTTPFVEIDPEGILIPQRLDGNALGDQVLQVDVSLWHIVDAEHALTWCGLFLAPGSERRPFSGSPEDRRCQTCIGRFRSDVIRSPVA